MRADAVTIQRLRIRSRRPVAHHEVVCRLEDGALCADQRWIFIRSVEVASRLNVLATSFGRKVQDTIAAATWGGAGTAADAEAVWFRDELEWRTFVTEILARPAAAPAEVAWFAERAVGLLRRPVGERLAMFWAEAPLLVAPMLARCFGPRQSAVLETLSDADAMVVLVALGRALGITPAARMPAPSISLRSAGVAAVNDPLVDLLKPLPTLSPGAELSPRLVLTAMLLAQRHQPLLLSSQASAAGQSVAEHADDLGAFAWAAASSRWSHDPIRHDGVDGAGDGAGEAAPEVPGSRVHPPRLNLQARSARPDGTAGSGDVEGDSAGGERAANVRAIVDSLNNVEPGKDPLLETESAPARHRELVTGYAALFYTTNRLTTAPLASLCREQGGWCVMARLLELAAGRAVDEIDDGLPLYLAEGAGCSDAAALRQHLAAHTLRRLSWQDVFPAPSPLADPAAVARPGRLRCNETHVDVFLSLSDVDLDIRMAGLDLDPGWVPALGRVVAIHYVEGAPW